MISTKRIRHDRIVSINAKVARNINRAIVLNSVRENQPISRARIAELTTLNKSTVSSIVESLLADDLVAEENKRGHGIGRRPIHLRVKTGKHSVGAIYIDSVKTVIAVVDLDGTIRRGEEIKTEPLHSTEFVGRCVDKLNLLRKQMHLPSFKGIGVTVAGVVDPLASKVLYAPNLGWEELDLGKVLREHSGEVESITLENDAKASALAELWFGRHNLRAVNFVFLSVGPGIGAGIVIDNHILSGSSHAAGEFGHMTIVEGGEPCPCGNQGCLEVYASDRSTVRRYATTKGLSLEQSSSITLSDIIDLAKIGDAAARESLLTSARYLGLGIANIVRTHDPEVVVIGGLITQAWDLIYPEIMETVKRRGFLGKHRNNAVLPTSLSASPALLGAAALSIRRIFTNYRIAI
jgi:predicted NBD/HSP70 family sugar kinase